MSLALLASVALLPIALALVLMVGLRWPATRAMPVAWLVTAVAGLFLWKMPFSFVLASTLNGFGGAINVLIIVFGAILILYTLRDSGGSFPTIDGPAGRRPRGPGREPPRVRMH